jgi:hypothetical protein
VSRAIRIDGASLARGISTFRYFVKPNYTRVTIDSHEIEGLLTPLVSTYLAQLAQTTVMHCSIHVRMPRMASMSSNIKGEVMKCQHDVDIVLDFVRYAGKTSAHLFEER